MTIISEIRYVASQYSLDEIERCIAQQITIGVNTCVANINPDSSIAILAESSYVRELMNKGMTLQEAIRKLGARMRQFGVKK